jgi:hypothetical protein
VGYVRQKRPKAVKVECPWCRTELLLPLERAVRTSREFSLAAEPRCRSWHFLAGWSDHEAQEETHSR